MANKKTASAPIPDFESSLKNLESIVTKMENGELSLEQSLQCFEEGISLARECQQALRQAQLRVESLTVQTQPSEENPKNKKDKKEDLD